MYILETSLHLWDATWMIDYWTCATVDIASSADSTFPTEHIFYSSICRDRKVTSKATPDSCRGTMLCLVAGFVPHAECNVNESVYPDWTTLRFGKSWVNHSELLWYFLPERRDCLEFPRVASLFPASVHGGPATNYDPWMGRLCNKSIKPIAHFLSKKVHPEICKVFCMDNLGRGHIPI